MIRVAQQNGRAQDQDEFLECMKASVHEAEFVADECNIPANLWFRAVEEYKPFSPVWAPALKWWRNRKQRLRDCEGAYFWSSDRWSALFAATGLLRAAAGAGPKLLTPQAHRVLGAKVFRISWDILPVARDSWRFNRQSNERDLYEGALGAEFLVVSEVGGWSLDKNLEALQKIVKSRREWWRPTFFHITMDLAPGDVQKFITKSGLL